MMLFAIGVLVGLAALPLGLVILSAISAPDLEPKGFDHS